METNWSRRVLFACGVLLVGGGCATTDPGIMALEARNQALVTQVGERDRAIQALRAEKAHLEQELAFFKLRGDVLAREKTARETTSDALREGIRNFTDGVMKSLREYYQKTEIVDFVGSEVCSRARQEAARNVLLVDMRNRLPTDGTLTGGAAYLSAPARLQFCLLRVTPDGAKYTVVRLSPEYTADRPGEAEWTFDVPIAARKGDLIGVYFPENAPVPFDDVGTGNVAVVPGPVKPDANLSIVMPEGRATRAYSFGMVGFLARP